MYEYQVSVVAISSDNFIMAISERQMPQPRLGQVHICYICIYRPKYSIVVMSTIEVVSWSLLYGEEESPALKCVVAHHRVRLNDSQQIYICMYILTPLNFRP